MAKKKNPPKPVRPAQEQKEQPGKEWQMRPRPQAQRTESEPGAKLEGKVAFITGGDSGIGRAVAILFAKEGAQVAFSYLLEHKDAEETRRLVEGVGRECLTIPGDVGYESACGKMIEQTVDRFGKLDVVVNNAGEQHLQESIEKISSEQLERTFRTNIFSCFFVVKAALKHLREGASIINSASVTAYRGSPYLLDYSATKGAIVAFTRSLALGLVERGIRVNGVAPGPIWTPLIPASFPAEKVAKFGTDVPMGRAGEPAEVAPCYLFLASNDSSYMTGQVLHPNGGEVING